MMYVLLKQGRLYYVKSIIQPVFYIQKYEEIYPSAEKCFAIITERVLSETIE